MLSLATLVRPRLNVHHPLCLAGDVRGVTGEDGTSPSVESKNTRPQDHPQPHSDPTPTQNPKDAQDQKVDFSRHLVVYYAICTLYELSIELGPAFSPVHSRPSTPDWFVQLPSHFGFCFAEAGKFNCFELVTEIPLSLGIKLLQLFTWFLLGVLILPVLLFFLLGENVLLFFGGGGLLAHSCSPLTTMPADYKPLLCL